MYENKPPSISLSRETATLILEIFRTDQSESSYAKKEALCDAISTALSLPHEPSLEVVKAEARLGLAKSTEKLAEAQSALADALGHGSESDQRTASAVFDTEETKFRGSQAAFETAAGRVLNATAESAEGERRAAYAKSQKAHDEALAALQGYKPLADEISRLFRILSFHADLAMADVEAADAARISPHVRNAADHLEKLIQEQKLGHTAAVTEHALAALRELAAHVRG
jgi:hypothetical protein